MKYIGTLFTLKLIEKTRILIKSSTHFFNLNFVVDYCQFNYFHLGR